MISSVFTGGLSGGLYRFLQSRASKPTPRFRTFSGSSQGLAPAGVIEWKMPTGQAGKHMPRGPLNRRDFISCLGGAAAWPLAARAQQPTMPVIGFLSTRSPGESAGLVAAFRDGLRESGFVEGQNLVIAFRWAEGRYEQLRDLAAELVATACGGANGGGRLDSERIEPFVDIAKLFAGK